MEPIQPRFGVIYKITNLVNGKVYVGKTRMRYPAQRWRQHRHAARTGLTTYLYKALRKYGVENFKFEVIDEATTQAEFDEKENVWIDFLGTLDRSKGYNIRLGMPNVICDADTRKVLSDQRKEWWSSEANRKFFSEQLWNAEKRATQSQKSKEWRATPEGLAATECVRLRRLRIRTCPTCGGSFAGVQWQAHTRRKSGCPTLPTPPRRKWAKPKEKKPREVVVRQIKERRRDYWTAERRESWGDRVRLWWESHPEAKKRPPEYRKKISDSITRLDQAKLWTPERRAAWGAKMKEQFARNAEARLKCSEAARAQWAEYRMKNAVPDRKVA